MLYKTTCALSLKGERVEAGTEVELSAEDAARFDAKDLEPISGEAPKKEPEIDLSTIAVEELTYEQAKARAKELGLSQGGSKADLHERIILHLQTIVEEEMEDHVLTQDDLDANPALVEEGMQVGDIVKFPKVKEDTE